MESTAEDIERDLEELERIVSLSRKEFLENLFSENRKNYLAQERQHRKYISRTMKAVDNSERGIDYSVFVD